METQAGVDCCRVTSHMLRVLTLSTRGKENQGWMNIVDIHEWNVGPKSCSF